MRFILYTIYCHLFRAHSAFVRNDVMVALATTGGAKASCIEESL